MELINAKDIHTYISNALRSVSMIMGNKTKEVIELLGRKPIQLFINALSIELAMVYLQKGIELADKKQSLLTLPDKIPVLITDSKSNTLLVVIPSNGKYYLVDGETEVDVSPSCWYDVPLLAKQTENGGANDSQELKT